MIACRLKFEIAWDFIPIQRMNLKYLLHINLLIFDIFQRVVIQFSIFENPIVTTNADDHRA